MPVCEIHGCTMPTRAVRVVYGLRRGLKQSPGYLSARRESFPHCDDWANGGCMVRDMRSQAKPVCPACVAARDSTLQTRYATWLASHAPEAI